MAGKIKTMIDRIIAVRSAGNPTLVTTTKTKLILKGVDPEKFTLSSDDDPAIIKKVTDIAREMGIQL